MIDRLARALKDEIGRQLGAHPVPGDASPDSWTATGGELDLEKCVCAVLTAMRSPGVHIHNAGAASDGQSQPPKLMITDEGIVRVVWKPADPTRIWQAMIDAAAQGIVTEGQDPKGLGERSE